jgi:predicted TIM-barrel fold metal-dependent hydrolase
MSRASCSCNVPNFQISDSRSLCDKFSITAAILSHTAPGPEIEKDPVKAADLARQFNEFCAGVRDQQPKRYGFFASVPSLHDTARCLEEIAYALDTLHADGVILFTSYTSPASPNNTDAAAHRVSYLGDPAFAPIWTDLNRRRAVVLIHPTYTPNLFPANDALPVTMLDFSHETARTALDLVVSNTLRDYAGECKIILSHGGGTLASVLDRVAVLGKHSGRKSAEQIREEVGWFYFDTALCASAQVDAVRRIAGRGHVLFGSDLPNAPVAAVEEFVDDQGEVGEGAARVLFPRFFE